MYVGRVEVTFVISLWEFSGTIVPALAGAFRAMPHLNPGDKAPEFELFDQHGNRFRLSEAIKRQHWQFLSST